MWQKSVLNPDGDTEKCSPISKNVKRLNSLIKFWAKFENHTKNEVMGLNGKLLAKHIFS